MSLGDMERQKILTGKANDMSLGDMERQKILTGQGKSIYGQKII
jgi:hypothetical protein